MVYQRGDVIVMKEHYRQGDVLIVRVDKIPEGVKPAPDLVLAHGEVTGHKHQILDAKRVKRYVAERLQYLAVRAKCKVQHEEHSPVTLPPGSYVVLIQTEYTPGELRAVMD